jgi:hypothetical protein
MTEARIDPHTEAANMICDQVTDRHLRPYRRKDRARVTVWYPCGALRGSWHPCGIAAWAAQYYEYVRGVPTTVEYANGR